MAVKSTRLRKTQTDALFRTAMLAESTRGSVSDYGSRAEENNPTSTQELSSINKKRLHSARDSIEVDAQYENDQTEDIDYDDDGRSATEAHGHTPKRSRPGDPTDWPLRNDASNIDHSHSKNPSLRKKQSALSLASGRRRESSHQRTPGRPSRFLEGSMNDRASKHPPAAFTENYDAVGRYLADQEAVSTLGDPYSTYQLGPTDTVGSGVTEDTAGSQRSGIWRFGKAVADWFNLSKFVREEAEKERQKRLLQRRQEKALKLYDEMKKTGQFYAVKTSVSHATENFTTPELHQTSVHGSGVSYHGSQIDVNEQCHPEFVRKAGPTSDATYGLMPPPSLPNRGISGTPVSISSRQSSAFNFKKPSFPNLKKVRSEVQLSSSSFVPPFVAGGSARGGDEDGVSNVLRKQPSKKDLQKVQRLNKKVSDLESQLEAARRHRDALMGVPPVPALPPQSAIRKTFVPGALPSLPSERLILQDLNFSPEDDAEQDVGSDAESAGSTVCVEAPPELKSDLPKKSIRRGGTGQASKAKAVRRTALPATSLEPKKLPKKRKSNGHGGESGEDDPVSEGEGPAEGGKVDLEVKGKPGRPRKSQKVGKMSSPGSVAKEQFTVMEDDNNDLATEEHGPDVLSAAPGDRHEDQITKGQSGQQPTLARSVASRKSKASKIPRHPASPPPIARSSATQTIIGQAVETSVSVTPDDVSIPPVPKLPPGIERMVVLSSRDSSKENVNVDPEKKLQPERLAEPYQWPDDVF